MTRTLQLYAIRHNPTGQFLPSGPGRGGRGFTHAEPIEANAIWLPRLFHSETSAKRALTWWLKGQFSVSLTGGYDHNGGYDEYEDWHHTPKPHRKAEEMEIVQIAMVLP